MITQIAASAVAGLVFGIGLVISGMINPAKVLNFLDIAGPWDPSLLFVMGGAILVTFFGYRLVVQQPAPLLAEKFDLPPTTGFDRRLVIGPAIFGIGWGLAGLCPGPAISALSLGEARVVLFVIALFAGLAAASSLTNGNSSH